jgi:predicted amino acid-binding ACT domain protein
MKALNIIQEDHPGLLAEVTTLLEKEGFAVQDFAGRVTG